MLLSFLAVTTSCKKENVINDFLLNQQIDRQLSPENVVKLSKSELTSLANQKYEVLYRIKTNNPGITFERLYPNVNLTTVAHRDTDCASQFNSARTTCNVVYIDSAFASVIVGAAVGVATAIIPVPIGAGVGAAGITITTYSYAMCMQTAIGVRDNCLKNQK